MYKFERTYAGTWAVTGPGLVAPGVIWDRVDDAERCAIALNQTHHYAEHKLAQVVQIRAALKREQHAVSTALRTPCHVSLVKHAQDVRALADQATAGPDGVDLLAPLRTREVVGTLADKAMPSRVVEMVVERVESLKREVARLGRVNAELLAHRTADPGKGVRKRLAEAEAEIARLRDELGRR